MKTVSTPSISGPSISGPSRSYSHEDWKQGYESQRQESAYWITDIEGTIPAELRGTLFRNGPGLLDIHGQRIRHPFDGDGMVCAIAFADGRAHFRNQFVRTAEYVAEQQAGKIIYRGVFGTQKPGGWLANCFDLKLKNIANTQVIYWGGKLLALWEAAQPHRLDPLTLDTLGLEDLGGILSASDPFAAHPRIDPACDLDGGAPRLVNFSVKPGGLSTAITLYEMTTQGQVVEQQTHIVPGFAFIHDFVITPNYAIFFQSPAEYNPLPFLFGLRGAGECLKLSQDKPTKVLVIPRHSNPSNPAAVKTLEVQAGFVFHHVNAFEDGDTLRVDSVCYEGPPQLQIQGDFRDVDFEAIAPGNLWRFRLHLSSQTVERELGDRRCVEFPVVNPAHVGRPYRYLYTGAAHAAEGNAPLQAILKHDWQTGEQQLWSAATRGFMGEPVFVPHPSGTREDEGWVLALIYDAAHHRSDVVILDGQDVSAGPIARLHLPYHIPYGLHGTFTSEYFGPNPKNVPNP